MENKTFWQELFSLGAGVLTNKINADAQVSQSATQSTAIAAVVRFGIVIAAIYFGGSFIIKLFKGR